MTKLTSMLVAAAFLASTGCYATVRGSGDRSEGQREEARPHEEGGHPDRAKEHDKDKDGEHDNHGGDRDRG